jgi:DNA-binding transcriptional LysR family regulator
MNRLAPSSDINRAREMEVLVQVAEAGGFSAAARAVRLTPSAVSKLVSRLEARIGARLLNRTTRKLALTAEGQVFYEQARRILADIDEAERTAAGAAPRGRVRVNSSVPFGRLRLIPSIPLFAERHPDIVLDLILTDAVIDLLDERVDIAIRVGPLRGGNLMARRLGFSRLAVVASPDYLARRGRPATLEMLARHDLIGFNFARQRSDWPFKDADGTERSFAVDGAVTASDGESARALAVAGAGVARLACFQVDADIEAGRLVSILDDLNPGDIEDIHAVYVGHRSVLPSRVRAVIDFLVEHVRLEG